MLMMSRRAGETILIGDRIEIVIAHIGRSRVKVGIRAPRDTPVIAREMKLVREENRVAAGAGPVADWGGLLARLEKGDAPLDRRQRPIVRPTVPQVSATLSDKGSARQEAAPKY
jgi:carbon storage regulator